MRQSTFRVRGFTARRPSPAGMTTRLAGTTASRGDGASLRDLASAWPRVRPGASAPKRESRAGRSDLRFLRGERWDSNPRHPGPQPSSGEINAARQRYMRRSQPCGNRYSRLLTSPDGAFRRIASPISPPIKSQPGELRTRGLRGDRLAAPGTRPAQTTSRSARNAQNALRLDRNPFHEAFHAQPWLLPVGDYSP
jgi:hypothetical protein